MAPWKDNRLDDVFPDLPGLPSKDAPDELAQRLAYSRLSELNAEYTIYSDGLAEGGVNNGGAGAVVTTGDPRSPIVTTTLMRRGSRLTSSYEEEVTAMHLALEWINEQYKKPTKVTLATDS